MQDTRNEDKYTKIKLNDKFAHSTNSGNSFLEKKIIFMKFLFHLVNLVP